MDATFDGPDIYAAVRSVAGELIELEEEVNLKISATDLQKKLKTVKKCISNKLNKDLENFKLQQSQDLHIELTKMKSNVDS